MPPAPAFAPNGDFELEDPAKLFGERCVANFSEGDLPDDQISLPACEPLVLKGTYASAIGALLAGCRHVFGYPITPSTEGAELMAKILPKLDGAFVQAVSEVAAVNMMYGAGGAGLQGDAALHHAMHMVGHAHRLPDVLFDHDDRGAAFADLREGCVDFLDHHGGEAEAEFVAQQDARVGRIAPLRVSHPVKTGGAHALREARARGDDPFAALYAAQ